MKANNNLIKVAFVIVVWAAAGACQKMERPALPEYPVDANPPGGSLKFYAAFDGTAEDKLLNAVDSIKATFPSDNPLTNSQDGISGKALSGESKKFVKYAKPNDWAAVSKSFTISLWEKRDGQTKNNTGTNGPEHPFSFKSSNGHWSKGNVFLLFEGDNTACALKMLIVDKNMGENWFTWEKTNDADTRVAGLLDNEWHHIALVYDASTSKMTLYVDGVANAHAPQWASHGDINIDDSKITEFRVGAGPEDNFDTDDWLSSSWKGALDQFRFYDVVLSASEVSSLFAGKQ